MLCQKIYVAQLARKEEGKMTKTEKEFNDCPTCKQDMRKPPREGLRDCPQCGQGIGKPNQKIQIERKALELRDLFYGHSTIGIELLPIAKSCWIRLARKWFGMEAKVIRLEKELLDCLNGWGADRKAVRNGWPSLKEQRKAVGK